MARGSNQSELQKQFGQAAEIPEKLKAALSGQEVQAFRNEEYFTLYFPKVFNNQDLTVIYDKVFEHFPTAQALNTGQYQRIIQIPTADM